MMDPFLDMAANSPVPALSGTHSTDINVFSTIKTKICETQKDKYR